MMTDTLDDLEREIETSLSEDTDDNIDQKKTKTPRTKRVTRRGEAKKKRGPPRPHKKISNDVLQQRVQKLQKRIDKARNQLEDASRHIDAYNKEKAYREGEAFMQ